MDQKRCHEGNISLWCDPAGHSLDNFSGRYLSAYERGRMVLNRKEAEAYGLSDYNIIALFVLLDAERKEITDAIKMQWVWKNSFNRSAGRYDCQGMVGVS